MGRRQTGQIILAAGLPVAVVASALSQTSAARQQRGPAARLWPLAGRRMWLAFLALAVAMAGAAAAGALPVLQMPTALPGSPAAFQAAEVVVVVLLLAEQAGPAAQVALAS